MKTKALVAVITLVFLHACTDSIPDVAAQMSEGSMKELRERGWRLLQPFMDISEGLPDPSSWPRGSQFLPLDDEGNIATGDTVAIQFARELEQPKELVASQPIYELTFFNDLAQTFITTNRLNVRETTDRLRREQVREIQFPRDAVAVKTFWHRLAPNQELVIRKWDWREVKGGLRLPLDRLGTECVQQEPTNGCLRARDWFYTIRVDDPQRFSCRNCPELQKDELLVLIGMHIVSKQMPDWLWATFWWRGDDSPSGEFWTCGDAQREVLENLRAPWTHYSMDVTSTFTLAKPRLEGGNPPVCGVPGEIGDGEQMLATYNPFVEAFLPKGLKSSCVDCHSRASTSTKRPDDLVPEVGEPPGPAVSEFEGHIRLDYLWSLRRGLGKTRFPSDDWP